MTTEPSPDAQAAKADLVTDNPPPEVAAQLDRLAALIAGSPHNLVSRGQRRSVREAHVAECAALSPYLAAQAGDFWIDVGTGGGLPGLVLALLQPEVNWTLIDARQKKAGAVRAFAEELGLSNVIVVAGRAEVLAHDPAYRGRFDGAVSRALAALPAVLELCRGFLRAGGRVAAVKGPRWGEEVAASEAARVALGFSEPEAAAVPGTVRPTWLVTATALGPPRHGYPRREGRPQSDPLGTTGTG